MKKLAVALGLTLALVLTACGSDSEDSGGSSDSGSDSGEEAAGDGEALYSETCASCHGPDATGLDGLGKDIAGTAFIVDSSTDEVVALVKSGRSVSDPENTTGVDMPPNGGNPALSDADIEAIVVYLQGL